MHEITEVITGVIGDHGLYAVFLLMLLDAVLPAASELVMVYAGVVAVGALPGHSVVLFGERIESAGWAYVAMAGAGAVGYTLGSIMGWAIGLYGGRPYLERHGRWLHVTPERLDRAEAWFERYGDAAVFLSRMLPVIRSFISIPAGIAEMRLGRYSVLTFLGTLPWCFGLAGAGMALGVGWERFHETWRFADYAIVGLVALGLLLLALRYRRQRTRRALERSA